ncbi:MAG: hypothetical protein EBZ48_14880, partial [Proteobacteria bacterium]|nr:hypothetical protein [Pseudomonadota bacterium]
IQQYSADTLPWKRECLVQDGLQAISTIGLECEVIETLRGPNSRQVEYFSHNDSSLGESREVDSRDQLVKLITPLF